MPMRYSYQHALGAKIGKEYLEGLSDIYQTHNLGFVIFSILRRTNRFPVFPLAFDFWRNRRCQLLCHRCSKRLKSAGGPHHYLKVGNLALRIELDDIYAFHAQRANAGAEFKDDRIVADKLPVIGERCFSYYTLLY